MATITSSGVGSGLDVEGIISKLMAIERQPLAKLQTAEASYQAKLTAFGTLKGAFASLQSAARALKSTTLFSGMTATSSDSTVFSASANTAATAGTHSIEVLARAQGQTIASQGFPSMTTALANADGKLKIELGTFTVSDDDPPVKSFAPDTTKTAITIDIAKTKSSLGDIRDAINNANAGVTARIVDVGNNDYKLTISSDATGAKTSIQLTALDSNGTVLAADNTGLARFNFDPTKVAGAGNEFDATVAAQDAHVKINSLDVYRSTNTISDAVTGVTLTLAKEGSSTLTVGKNTAAVSSALDAFVKAYNAANDQVRQLSTYDVQNQRAALLTGDSGARALQSALREIVGMGVLTESSSIRTLSDIGITLSAKRNGSLEFNTATLDRVLKERPDAVAQLITNGNGNVKGIATRATTLLDSVLSENGGVLASRTDGIGRNIKDIGKRQANLVRRLETIEARYRRQFSALDSMVSSMQSTSQFLTQQLSALSSNKS